MEWVVIADQIEPLQKKVGTTKINKIYACASRLGCSPTKWPKSTVATLLLLTGWTTGCPIFDHQSFPPSTRGNSSGQRETARTEMKQK